MSKDKDYLTSMKRKASVIETDLKTLSTLDNNGNYSVGEKLQRISRAFRDIQRVNGEILSIASDPMRTIPGLKLARDRLAPLGVAATTALKNMQQTMLAEGINEDNLPLLNKINDMLYNLARLSASIRAYLSFRDADQEANVRTFVKDLIENAKRLLDGEELELDQEDALTQVQESLSRYEKNFGALVAVHGSDHWRQDSYQVRTRLAPLENRIRTDIDALVSDIRARTEASTAALDDSLDKQGAFTLILIGSGMLVGLLLMGIIIRLVQKRLNRLLKTVPILPCFHQTEGIDGHCCELS